MSEFDNLNKYEKAYIRSQLRKLRKKKASLTGWLSSFFSRNKDHYQLKRIDAIVRGSKKKAHRLFSKYLDHLDEHSYYEEASPHHEEYYPVGTRIIPRHITETMKRKLKSKKNNSWMINILFLLGTFFLIGVIIVGIWFTTLEIPDVSTFEERKISNSTKIYDKTGEVILYDIHENIQRSVVSFDDISQDAKDAIIAIEDHSFYEHNGVVISSTIRGVFQTVLSTLGLRSGGTAGGSTLTQQVVKNTLLNSQKLISRKVKEWILAYKIEKRLTKDQILEIYLNEAPYGGTIYGIQEASRVFFGVTASELTLGQAAYLAAIPNLPTYYSPYGPNRDKLDERQQTVLREMKRYGFITDEEYRAALEEEVEFKSQEENRVKALHFVQYIRAYLEEEYGTDLVENGGLKVVTTLDYELQEKAEEIIKSHIEEVEDQYNASNAALVAIEAKTGQIVSMVGSRDYFDEDIDGNYNVAIAPRQPGSSFKPVAYANAFEHGYLPETVVFDTKTQFNGRCDAYNLTSADGCYAPTNYDNEFLGPLSLRNALAQSRNIPAIKVLYLGGLASTMKLAQEMGINTLTRDPNFYGLGLVLGGGEVSLLELTGAYTVFGNEGVFNKPTGILLVEDADGNVLEEYEEREERVLSENTARMVSSILSDNTARTPLFGSQSFLYFGGRSVAGKTGTTNDNRDAWLIGYTPEFAVGVWTGNNDNTPMKKGSSISGKPWRQFMDEIIKEYDNENFVDYELPENFDSLPPIIRGVWQGGSSESVIDSRFGQSANEDTPEEYQVSDTSYFDPHTILHWIDKSNPTELYISSDDPQYQNWEASVQTYARENYQVEYQGSGNKENMDTENPSSYDVEVKGMRDGDDYDLNESERITIGFDGINIDSVEKVEFFVNGIYIDMDDNQPFTTTLTFDELTNLTYTNNFEVIATSTGGVAETAQVSFVINDLE